ncbi:hypothetical protein J4402_04275 [Candidatus Pacearchaeota archaeon]|nr:hypothetical protein [Candidatus Pacearchaeota archaeon]
MKKGLGGIIFLFSLIFLIDFVNADCVDGWTEENNISQYGITWFFDKPYQCGTFVNGDFWVVGIPNVTILRIDPPSRDVEGRIKNGAMTNPQGNSAVQGFDNYNNYNWDVNSNVAFGVGTDGKILDLSSNTSLISTISIENPNVDDKYRFVDSAAILTVLNSAPDDAINGKSNYFRPAYSGNNKNLFFHINTAISNRNLLGFLNPNEKGVSVPTLYHLTSINPDDQDETIERMFERPWLNFLDSPNGPRIHPAKNMERDMGTVAGQVSEGALALQLQWNTDKTTSDILKRRLLIGMTQFGIDNMGIAKNSDGLNWWAGGQTHAGNKWPILFAGVMLNDNINGNQDDEMRNISARGINGVGYLNAGYISFQEDESTFYVTRHPNPESVWDGGAGDGTDENYDIFVPNPNPDTSGCNNNLDCLRGYKYHNPGFIYYGHGIESKSTDCKEYNDSLSGLAEWGIEHTNSKYTDDPSWDADYRAGNGNFWTGFILSTLIMEDSASMKTLWNHSALFDYIDRYNIINNYTHTKWEICAGNSLPEPDKPFGISVGEPIFSDNVNWCSAIFKRIGFAADMWDVYRKDYGCVWKESNRYDCNGTIVDCNFLSSCVQYSNSMAIDDDPCGWGCDESPTTGNCEIKKAYWKLM